MQFYQLPLADKMEIVTQQGEHVGSREYYHHTINLYAVSGIWVEVWYSHTSNSITHIEPVEDSAIEQLYADRVEVIF